MSFAYVVPEAVASAAKALEGIGSELTAARSAAAVSTTGVVAAAQDEISIAVSRLFSGYGREFFELSAQAQAFHAQFLNTLNAGVGQYLSAEVTNIEQTLANAGVAARAGNPAASITDLLPTSAQAVSALDYSTPFGPIQLVMDVEGTVVTGGSLSVPSPLALVFDAISPPFGAVLALQAGGSTFVNAVQTGNATLAAQTFFQTPVNAVNSFFFGGQYFAGSVPVPSNTGYSSAVYAVPVGGLFSPLSPVVLTLYSDSGTPTTFALSGTEFGGPFMGIASVFPS